MDLNVIGQRITEAAREIAHGTRGGTVNLEQVECGLAALDALVAELGAPAAADPEAGEPEAESEDEDEPEPAAERTPTHRTPVRRRR